MPSFKIPGPSVVTEPSRVVIPSMAPLTRGLENQSEVQARIAQMEWMQKANSEINDAVFALQDEVTNYRESMQKDATKIDGIADGFETHAKRKANELMLQMSTGTEAQHTFRDRAESIIRQNRTALFQLSLERQQTRAATNLELEFKRIFSEAQNINSPVAWEHAYDEIDDAVDLLAASGFATPETAELTAGKAKAELDKTRITRRYADRQWQVALAEIEAGVYKHMDPSEIASHRDRLMDAWRTDNYSNAAMDIMDDPAGWTDGTIHGMIRAHPSQMGITEQQGQALHGLLKNAQQQADKEMQDLTLAAEMYTGVASGNWSEANFKKANNAGFQFFLDMKPEWTGAAGELRPEVLKDAEFKEFAIDYVNNMGFAPEKLQRLLESTAINSNPNQDHTLKYYAAEFYNDLRTVGAAGQVEAQFLKSDGYGSKIALMNHRMVSGRLAASQAADNPNQREENIARAMEEIDNAQQRSRALPWDQREEYVKSLTGGLDAQGMWDTLTRGGTNFVSRALAFGEPGEQVLLPGHNAAMIEQESGILGPLKIWKGHPDLSTAAAMAHPPPPEMLSELHQLVESVALDLGPEHNVSETTIYKTAGIALLQRWGLTKLNNGKNELAWSRHPIEAAYAEADDPTVAVIEDIRAALHERAKAGFPADDFKGDPEPGFVNSFKEIFTHLDPTHPMRAVAEDLANNPDMDTQSIVALRGAQTAFNTAGGALLAAFAGALDLTDPDVAKNIEDLLDTTLANVTQGKDPFQKLQPSKSYVPSLGPAAQASGILDVRVSEGLVIERDPLSEIVGKHLYSVSFPRGALHRFIPNGKDDPRPWLVEPDPQTSPALNKRRAETRQDQLQKYGESRIAADIEAYARTGKVPEFDWRKGVDPKKLEAYKGAIANLAKMPKSEREHFFTQLILDPEAAYIATRAGAARSEWRRTAGVGIGQYKPFPTTTPAEEKALNDARALRWQPKATADFYQSHVVPPGRE